MLDTVIDRIDSSKLNGDMLTIREVARLLHAHPSSIRRWADQGLLTCYRVGLRNDRRFRPEDLRSFVESSRVAQPQGV